MKSGIYTLVWIKFDENGLVQNVFGCLALSACNFVIVIGISLKLFHYVDALLCTNT